MAVRLGVQYNTGQGRRSKGASGTREYENEQMEMHII